MPDSPEPFDVKVTAMLNGQARSAAARSCRSESGGSTWPPAPTPTSAIRTSNPSAPSGIARTSTRPSTCSHRFPEFRWNIEAAWQAENYVASRSGQRLDDFYRFAREGKIGIQALFCNELTGLCSHEEACRLTWFAHKLCREQGIPYLSAMISDVPTQEATLPMILSSAGIRYFSSGINNDRAYPFTQMQSKCPCWWEGAGRQPGADDVHLAIRPGPAMALTQSFNEARPRFCRSSANMKSARIIPSTRFSCTAP